ncbi:MAG: CTP synthase [Verrucomicrobia bacterium]|nr:CTP synthase [Verrucomicrobiota bacterium]
MTKHIFVTGGVVSSLGKGLTAASVALLLQRRGYKVRLQKMDPYLNVDPGTMSPYQHGEVYVTKDGAEADLDLGHYERFSGTECTKTSNYTAGGIYSRVISREREGGYLGKTVQVIPHITDEIKAAIRSHINADTDILITEIGGTVGDIESLPFLEAIRQFRQEIGRDNGIFMHITLVPYIKAAGEMKTKPSQQSVGLLRTIGISPDILVCRCEHDLTQEHKDKMALFCNVPSHLVIEEKDVAHSIYEVPLDLARQDVDVYVLELLRLHVNSLSLRDWRKMVNTLISPRHGEIEIAVVGKYIGLQDSYKSIYEALTHGGIANNVGVKVRMVESEDIEDRGALVMLKGVSGVLVPGGFGDRGIEGKIQAIRYARKHGLPFFGICLGMQCAVMEFGRNVCRLPKANSTEFDVRTPHPVIDLIESQRSVKGKGGTMRLGDYPCHLTTGSKARRLYARPDIVERHRHRYEFNNAYRERFESNGMIFSGQSPDGELVEIVELPDHPWFVGCQFHPEFQSTPLNSHRLFRDFVRASLVRRRSDEGIPSVQTKKKR